MTGNKKFVVSIDVENGNDWCNHEQAHVRGVREIMDICEDFGARATFMWMVMLKESGCGDPYADAEILKEIVDRKHSLEAHVHPTWHLTSREWRAVEYFGLRGNNLPAGIGEYPLGNKETPGTQTYMVRKIAEDIRDISGVRPVCFRGGGLSFSRNTLLALESQEYQVDSSCVPEMVLRDGFNATGWCVDWRGAPAEPYTMSRLDYRREGQSKVLEVPISVAVDMQSGVWDKGVNHEQIKAIFDSWHKKHQESGGIFVLLAHTKGLLFPLANGERTGQVLTAILEYVARQYDDVAFVTLRECVDT